MEGEKKVFVINPGSTSTKLALFIGAEKVFSAGLEHDAAELKRFRRISDQFPFRLQAIQTALTEAGVSLEGIDAIAARCGGLVGLRGGVYEVNEKLLQHARDCFTAQHPNTLGPQLAEALQKKYGGRIFCVNPPDVDELDDVERITGFHELFRQSKGHPLNQKENCIRYATSQGKRYEDMNLICCHLGGGVTVAAHRRGKYCCVNDAVNGDGPMAPTRSGALPAADLVKMCYSGQYTEQEMYERITKRGGFVDHLGTADGRRITERIAQGDHYAKLIYDAFIYQVAKAVGGCAAALRGEVDAIILTGGLAYDKCLVQQLTDYIRFLAPVCVQPGEFEMEALAAGAIRALCGETPILSYTGIPVFTDFEALKQTP